MCSTSQTWNGADGLTSQTDGAGNASTFGYDGLKRRTSAVTPRNDGQYATLRFEQAYDLNGNVVAKCPPRHFTEGGRGACAGSDAFDVLIEYNAANRPTASTTYENSATPARAQTTRYSYDADANIVKITDANNHPTTAAYDLLDRQTSRSAARSASVNVTTTMTYDAGGNLLTTSVPDSGITYATAYSYDAAGRVVDTVQGASNGTLGATTADGGQNIRTRTVFDPDGNVIAVYSPRAFSSSAGPLFSPDEAFKQVVNYDADGRKTRMYQARANAATPDTIRSQGAGMVGSMEKWCPTASTNAPGFARPYPYMPNGYPTYPADAEICYTDYQYDSAGRQIASTDAVGTLRTVGYTDDGLVASERGPSPVDDSMITTAAYYYDANGKAAKTADAANRTTLFSYTSDGLLQSRTDPPNGTNTHVTSLTYDADGNRTSLTDPMGFTSKQTYFSDGRVASTMTPSDPASPCIGTGLYDVTSYGYDPAGNATTVMSPSANAKDCTNPQGLATKLSYTWDNLLQQQMRPALADGTRWRTQTMQYTAAGQKASQNATLTDATGATVYADARPQTFTYYPDQRLKQETGRDGTSSNQRAYDADGNLTSQVSKDGAGRQTASITATFYLDGLLRSTDSSNPDGTTGRSEYDYDGMGRIYQRVPPSGRLNFFQYNAAGLPASETIVLLNQLNAPTYWGWDFSYTVTGEVRQVNAGNSGAGFINDINSQIYEQNPDGTLASTSVTKGTLGQPGYAVTAKWAYTYDKNKRVTQWAFTGGPSASGAANYYPSGRLQQTAESGPCNTATMPGCTGTTSITKSATWDRDGNRLTWGSASYSYNPDDSIATGARAFTYNTAGAITQDDCGTYAYDGFDRRATASIAGGGASCPKQAASLTYSYDALDRLVTVTNGSNRNVILYTGFGRLVDTEQNWSGSTQQSLVLNVADGAGSLRGVFTFAPSNLAAPQTAEIASDDGRGSITTMSNPSGTVGCNAYMDAFGQPEFIVSGTSPCSTGGSANTAWFRGGRFDANAGAYSFGSRAYVPANGSWSQPDGLRASNGRADASLAINVSTRNPYSYVGGDPINLEDPTGHAGCMIVVCGVQALQSAWGAAKQGASWLLNKGKEAASWAIKKAQAAIQTAATFIQSTVTKAEELKTAAEYKVQDVVAQVRAARDRLYDESRRVVSVVDAFNQARDQALAQMAREAQELKANAARFVEDIKQRSGAAATAFTQLPAAVAHDFWEGQTNFQVNFQNGGWVVLGALLLAAGAIAVGGIAAGPAIGEGVAALVTGIRAGATAAVEYGGMALNGGRAAFAAAAPAISAGASRLSNLFSRAPEPAAKGAGGALDEGIIYLRTDVSGGLKPYVGQSKSLGRFLARQSEHAIDHPDAGFRFQVLEENVPQAALDRYEQFYINAYGGPTTKTFVGGLSNARNQMSWLRYWAAGGETGIP
jgi:RHS repeat-associated protein